jgi:hypothetical protein
MEVQWNTHNKDLCINVIRAKEFTQFDAKVALTQQVRYLDKLVDELAKEYSDVLLLLDDLKVFLSICKLRIC